MKKSLRVIIPLVLLLLGLRVYGAYQGEQEQAVTRAEAAEKKAAELDAEGQRLQGQVDCNQLWQKYKTAELDRQIAQLQGRLIKVPVPPACSGYAHPSLDLIMHAFQVNMAALDSKRVAECERHYSASRKYQTVYLGMRMWGFLIGNKPQKSQAEFVFAKENAARLASCLEGARNDPKRADTCKEMFGSGR